MKARRTLQIIVGVLCVLAAALVTTALLAIIIKYKLPQDETGMYQTPHAALTACLALPLIELLLAAILILTRNKSGDGKNIAGCVFALLGALPTLVLGLALSLFYMTSTLALAIIGVSVGLPAFIILFACLALCVKPKNAAEPAKQTAKPTAKRTAEAVEAEPLTEQTDAAEPTSAPAVPVIETTPVEPAAAPIEPATPVEAEATTEPTAPATTEAPVTPFEATTVRETVNDVYGNKPHVSDHKLATLRMLLESGALSEEEYLKILESYIK